MKRLRFLISAGLAVAFSAQFSYAAQKPFELSIIHINDHHSHLDPEPLELKRNGKTYEIEAGGMARVASQIKALRQRSENPLVLHAGDAMSGTLYFTLFKGEADVELMNETGFDAFTLGNHEFDEGDDVLAKFIDKANFPVISANVEVLKGSVLSDKWKPYIVKEIDGQKVGIIGLETAQKTSASSRPSSAVSFYDEILRAQRYTDELRAQGVEKIILLSHFGYDNDQRLAQNTKGIDVIIDGDSHTLLGDFSAIGLASSGQYPTIVRSLDGKEVCIAQAWEYSKAVGELHVLFDGKGNVASCNGKTHLISGENIYLKDAKGEKKQIGKDKLYALQDALKSSGSLAIVNDDEKIAQKLSVYQDQIKSKSAEVIGTIGEDLRHIRVPGKTYDGVDGKALPLGSELAPVIAASFYHASLRADLCIQNAGGVRSGLTGGQMTTQGVYALLPFSNTLVEIELSGAEVKQVLEDALINFYDNYGSDGSFPYAYGLRYDIDMSRPKNDRVYNMEIKERRSGKWVPIDMSKRYVVVVNSYIAEGRDGYTTLQEVQQQRGKGVDTYLDYAMSFAKYVQSINKQGKKVMRLPKEEHCIKSYKI
ncbi:NAD nucleotidase [Sulfurovum sp.]|jgi:5'-nucleotidase|uniref:NAD nucleotidase n=1 Tax=Sulfurovum sp. TaxID=1969726 RepID=UPI002A36E76A|nr:NAD nucleotidase [Sulfurovum sp.]MDD2450325.1 NAD nucleotidase [Sulfurovum sp.]MDY0401876.1 NAD nucleotidase [Sulfurovum sp.]